MSSIFRNAIKSRRKRKKTRSTTPVNFSSSAVSKSSVANKPTCDFHDYYETKKTQPQQQILRVSRISCQDDERRRSLHECHVNRHRTLSFKPTFASKEKESYDDFRISSSSDALNASPKDSHSRRHFLKSRRRKTKHDTEFDSNSGFVSSDTVASGGYNPNNSSSEHDRRQYLFEQNHRGRRSRSFDESSPCRSQDKEIYNTIRCESSCSTTHATPKDSHGRQQFFKALRGKYKNGAEHNTNTGLYTPDTVLSDGYIPNKTTNRSIQRVAISSIDDKPSSWRNTDLPATKPKMKPVKLRFKQKDNTDHQQTTASNHYLATKDRIEVRIGKRYFGNTKTVIMNGDIVVSKSYHRKSTVDTVTVTSSASSNSKAKAMRRKSERNARAASALDDKGNDLFEKGYFDKAMACYTKALKLKRRTFAHLLDESDDLEEELIRRDDSGNLADPQALVSMATSINNIGYLRQRSGDATPEETMATYKKSLRIKRRILGNDSLSVGKTLNNIGSVHYLKREFDRALSAYDEGLEIMKANLGEKHPDVATVMSNIGDVYLAQDNKETSIKYYRLALVIRWEAFGEKSPRVVRLLEKISNLEIGDMTCKMSSQKTNTAWGDDVNSEIMVGSDFQPVSEGLMLLQEQVKNDIEQVDKMERNAAVELLKDKIIIIRGMRDVWNGSGPELLDNDSASVQTAMSRLSGR